MKSFSLHIVLAVQPLLDSDFSLLRRFHPTLQAEERRGLEVTPQLDLTLIVYLSSSVTPNVF